MRVKQSFWPGVVLFSCLLLCGSFVRAAPVEISHSQPETITGPSQLDVASDQKHFYFDLLPGQAMSVEVIKQNSNLALSVLDDSGAVVRRLKIPDRLVWFLDVQITDKDCNRCQLIISALSRVDSESRYSINFTPLDQQQDKEKAALKRQLSRLFYQWPKISGNKERFTALRQQALRLATASGAMGDRDSMLKSYFLASVASHHLGDTAQEILAMLKVQKNNPPPDFRLHSDYRLGSAYYRSAAWDKARAHLNRVIEQAGSSDGPLAGAARLRLGNLDDRLGFPRRAEKNFSQALALFESFRDHYFMISARMNLAWSYFRAGNTGQAFSGYQLAMNLANQYEAPSFEADALTKLARVYAKMGDIDQALETIDRSLEISQQNAAQHTMAFLRARSYQAKGIILIAYGMYEPAIDALNEAKILHQQLHSDVDLTDVRYLLGKSYFYHEDFDKADSYFQQTLEYDLKSGNSQNIAQTYALLAETALQQAEQEKPGAKRKQALARADDYQQKAFQFFEKVEDYLIDSDMLSQAAMIAFYNGRFDASQAYLDKAMRPDDKALSPYQKVTLDYRRAKIAALNNEKTKALRLVSTIHELVNRNSRHIYRSDVKRAYLALQQKISALHVTLLHQQNADAGASLVIAELYRSRTLNESIANLNRNVKVNQQQQAQRDSLQNQLVDLAQAYYLAQAQHSGEPLKAIKKTAEKLQKLEADINKTRPRTERVTEQRIQQAVSTVVASMKPNQAMVYYDLNPEGSFYWLISASGISLHSLPPETEIKHLVQQVLAWAGASPDGQMKAGATAPPASLQSLSEVLLGESSQFWRQYSDLIIVPDQSLNYLPFSLLRFPDSGQSLVASKNISYVPSILLYQILQQHPQRQAQKGNMLVVANPSMIAAKPEIGELALRGGFGLSELPYSGLEAKRIRKASSKAVSVLTRDSASKQQFLNMALQDFSILHFAMHGLSNSRIPSLGGLVFSNQNSNDNLLLSTEITRLPLNADLVVVSGCETGIGKNINGEGLFGLSRAFFEAGGRRVLASLWAVQDDATAELMGEFYQNLLQRKQKPAEALRNAKLHVRDFQRPGDFRKLWQHPFYWAGFVLQGEGDGQLY